ncbi:MAG: ABC transporter substrate-binding protein [Spirochaetes bacterium]|nr:ABC transporter substrate-binding protein [Spirochaetota bacterium]
MRIVLIIALCAGVLLPAVDVRTKSSPYVISSIASSNVVISLSEYLKAYKTNASTPKDKEFNQVQRFRIATIIDFDACSRSMLGKFWDKFTTNEQSSFTSKLRACIESFGYGRASEFLNGIKDLAVKETADIDGSDYVVQLGTAAIGDKALSITLVYKVDLVNGRRVITDVWYDTVVPTEPCRIFVQSIISSPKWLVPRYRDRIEKILRDKNREDLFERMERITAQYTK